MRRAPKRLERGRASSGPVLLAALAGFVVICGVVILVVGGPGRKEVKADPACKQMDVLSRQVGKALQSMNAAEGALNSANYGAIRGHLQRGRESLAVVRHQLKEAKKKAAAKETAKKK